MDINESFEKGTILSTKKAIIDGHEATVEQVLGKRNKQDIFYRVDGTLYEREDFWGLNPKFLTKVN